MIGVQSYIYSKTIAGLGTITLRPIQLDTDIDFLYDWVSQPYAKYWGMLEQSKEEVKAAYQDLETNVHHHALIGELNKKPIFLTEKYRASNDAIAEHYSAKDDDYGMHILVAPVQKKIPQFTWHVFSFIMDYFFSLPEINRVVVEPDVNNEKIHILNKKAGFVYQKNIELSHKTAALAFCTRNNYVKALTKLKDND